MATSASDAPKAPTARYPVTQPDGGVRHQVILITGAEDGEVIRGFPLGYEDEAASFRASDFADE